MERELVSVIIPVYGVEPYLEKCVQSVLEQTYEQLEVILVDDGSPDGCPAMCDAFARRDGRVRVIHKQNGGQGSARNRGLDAARGTYIGFVDSDDYIAPDMYERLYAALRDADADMAVCDLVRLYEDGSPLPPMQPLQPGVITPEQMYERMERAPARWRYLTPVNRLYRRELFRTIRFPEDRRYEDLFVAHLLYELCRTIAVTDAAPYYYIQRVGSTMRSPVDIANLDEVDGYMDHCAFYRRKGLKALAGDPLRRSYVLLWRVLHAVDVYADRAAVWPRVRRVMAAQLRQLDPSAGMLLFGYVRALVRSRFAPAERRAGQGGDAG